MYEENRTGSVIKDVLLQIILVVIFVFLLLWLFPTKSYVDNKLQDGLDPLYQELFNEHLQTMKDAGQSYYTKDRLPKKVGDKVSITLGEMLDKKLVTSFVDSNNKQCNLTGSYIEVTKMDSEYMMKVNLSCSDKSDYIIVYMGCYNYCDDYLCEKKETTTTTKPSSNKKPSNNNNSNVTPTVAKKYKYEYVLKTSAGYSDWSDWSDWSTTKVTENTYRDVDTIKKLEVVRTENTVVDTTAYFVPAIKQVKTTTYNAKLSLTCPSGYFSYWKGSTKVCAARTTASTQTSTTISNTVQTAALINESKVCSTGKLNNSTVYVKKLLQKLLLQVKVILIGYIKAAKNLQEPRLLILLLNINTYLQKMS